jgi:hypothetical protein
MNLYRVGVKLFAADASNVVVKDFVPVFHSWIQRQCIEGHLLVDVHDYSHIHHGPGILLVAHEGNFSTDLADGRLGLAYTRKQPAGPGFEANLQAAVTAARRAAALLEAEPVFGGRLTFRRDETLVIANDRLAAPNDAEAFAALQPAIASVLGASVTLSRAGANSRDRLTIHVRG